MVALTRMLGTADATEDLERRVQSPVRPLYGASARQAGASSDSASPEPAVSASGRPAPGTGADAPAGGEASSVPRRAAVPDDDFDAYPTVELTSSMFADTGVLFTPVPPPAHAASAASSDVGATEGVAAEGATSPVTPIAGYPRPRRQPVRRRYWLVALTAFVALILVGSLAVLFINQAGRSDHSAATPSATATTAQPYAISRALDFDPRADGGSGDENTGDAKLAIDGNPATAWRTEMYRGSAQMGGLKPGVGLIVDLGSAKPVTSVTVTFTGQGTTADIKVPITATTSADPPVQSRTQWRTVATKSGAKGATTFELATPETTRYVLVYLTTLPADGSGFRGGISQIVVR
jgi:putative peptidoglycan lipid II flippase